VAGTSPSARDPTIIEGGLERERFLALDESLRGAPITWKTAPGTYRISVGTLSR
jgi:hypothetical protein